LVTTYLNILSYYNAAISFVIYVIVSLFYSFPKPADAGRLVSKSRCAKKRKKSKTGCQNVAIIEEGTLLPPNNG